MRTTGTRKRSRLHAELLEARRFLSTTFISDVPLANAINGWGPVELDHSNGEVAVADGHTITLNGTTYAKGLGVHAYSEVAVDIQASSGYTDFQSDIGVDDEVGNSGSVIFQVWIDNNKLFESGIKTGASAIQSIDVPIGNLTGRLRLIVTDAGNGKDYDHADWASARLFTPGSPPLITLTRTTGGDIPENGGSAGFLFSRQGSTNGPLVVNFGSGGTALRPNDYTLRLGDANGPILTGNTVTIPNGAGSVLITAVTVNDSLVDPNESILLGVAASASYSIGSPNTASTNIIDDDQAVGFAYVSDLPINTGQNGWGPVEQDRSNGEIGASDGHTLTLNGTSYAKGLGVHANSDVSYNLGGSYNTFQAVIGVDDEVGQNGSVIFQVFANNVKVYESGVRTGADPGLPISVNINAAAQFRLVVTDAGNGNAFDHADWANAKLLFEASPPSVILTRTSGGDIPEDGGTAGFSFSRQGSTVGALSVNFSTGGTATRGSDYVLHLGDANGAVITGNSVTIPDGATSVIVTAVAVNDLIVDVNENLILSVASGSGYNIGGPNTASVGITDDDQNVGFSYLTDLPINSSTNGWGPIEIDRSNGESGSGDGHTITLNGVTYAKGLGVHANSEVIYNLNGGFTTFEAVIGVDDEVGNNGSVVFQVYSNGNKIYDSGTRTGSQAGLAISLGISGTTQLKLVVTDAGNGKDFDHADWANALVRI